MRTRIHLGTNKADLDAKEVSRERLQKDLQAFESKGGKVEKLPADASSKPLLHLSMQQLNDATWDKRIAQKE